MNVLNGMRFETENDEQKIEDTREYLNNFTISEKAMRVSAEAVGITVLNYLK